MTPKFKRILIIIGIIIGVYVLLFWWAGNSQDKQREGVQQEQQRLEQIEQQINNSISERDYEKALSLVNTLYWKHEEFMNKDKVDQTNSQRNDFTKTINELKLRKDSLMAFEAAQKARQQQAQHDSKLLSQQKEMIEKLYQDSLNKIKQNQ